MAMRPESVTGEKKPNSSWVVEMEKMLADHSPHSMTMEAKRWEAQSIYRVPEWLKGATDNSKAYQPQLVALGPFHHGDPNLMPMEEHKRRAVVHLVKRSKKPLNDFISAIKDVAEQLQAAYGKDLDVQWRDDRERFLEVMLTDGCFLLEVVDRDSWDYDLHDPIFSTHGRIHIWPIIRSDMLLIENQLPLLVLKTILGVMPPNYRKEPMDKNINLGVLRFLDPARDHEGAAIAKVSLRLHPLELYHGSLVYRDDAHENYKSQLELKYESIPSAVEIRAAGIKIMKNKTGSLLDIHFDRGVLCLPAMRVDSSTESLYLNLMAFERLLHAGAGDVVTAYVILMDNLINSNKDVAVLSSKGVIKNRLGCNKEVAKLFNGIMSSGKQLSTSNALHRVQADVKAYCGEPWNKWWASLLRTHFTNPWALISFVAAIIILIATLLQTVYTVMTYYEELVPRPTLTAAPIFTL